MSLDRSERAGYTKDVRSDEDSDGLSSDAADAGAGDEGPSVRSTARSGSDASSTAGVCTAVCESPSSDMVAMSSERRPG
jgi:hypothetical protein